MSAGSRPILVRRAGQLLTLAGGAPKKDDLGIVRNGAVLLRDGRIAAAGPARVIEKMPSARRATEIDARGRVVMPGFVDSHTHLVFGPPRLTDYEMRISGASYAEIAAAGGGILSSVRAVRSLSPKQLRRAGGEFPDGHGTARDHDRGS